MIKFRCFYGAYNHITVGKIYDVITYIDRGAKYPGALIIINDIGEECKYLRRTVGGKIIFEDVTIEHRNNVINEILA